MLTSLASYIAVLIKLAPGLSLLMRGFLGLLKDMRQDLRLFSGPSTKRSASLKWPRSLCHRACLASTLGLPMMITPCLALVKATLRRLGSLRKPMPWCSLALTQERMMKSFSLPWKASTLATSNSWRGKVWDNDNFMILEVNTIY